MCWPAGTELATALLTKFFVTNSNSVAAHPSYDTSTLERDIAVMRIDLTQFEGPPPSSSIAPVGGYAKGVSLPLLYLHIFAPHSIRLGHLEAELANECPDLTWTACRLPSLLHGLRLLEACACLAL